MEESVREAFGLKKPDLRQIPALNLAFLGDAVYELILRTIFVEENTCRGQRLHKKVEQYVSAVGQARLLEALLPLLTEEEAELFRRGRNAKPESMAKHATAGEYLKATGLEALLAYLYLDGRTARAVELVRLGIENAENSK